MRRLLHSSSQRSGLAPHRRLPKKMLSRCSSLVLQRHLHQQVQQGRSSLAPQNPLYQHMLARRMEPQLARLQRHPKVCPNELLHNCLSASHQLLHMQGCIRQNHCRTRITSNSRVSHAVCPVYNCMSQAPSHLNRNPAAAANGDGAGLDASQEATPTPSPLSSVRAGLLPTPTLALLTCHQWRSCGWLTTAGLESL